MKLTTALSLLAFGVSLLLLLPSCETPTTEEVVEEVTPTYELQIDSLLQAMTLEEKTALIHASSSFTSGGIERLGIPELTMSDGPHGVRHEHGRDWEKDENVADSSTYLPVGVTLAATWNRDLGYQFGEVLGQEANYRGKDIILGPGFNLIRSPLNGRNFEYLSEDPYLNAEMAVGYIKGVQDQGIAACAKHYIANTLEFEREKVNVEMSERVLRELYLPPFKASVQEGKVKTIMAAYNKFRDTYCAHSAYLLDTILRKEYGFEGLVVSDWMAVKDTKKAATVGLDIEMGTDLTMFGLEGGLDYDKFYLADTLITLVKAGEIDESYIDAKVRNILRLMFEIHKFDTRPAGSYNTAKHQSLARKVADEGIVLLKNEGVLPLAQDGMNKLAVVGANATRKHAGGGGSSQVKAYYETTPLEGLSNMLSEGVAIEYAPGYVVDRETKSDPTMIAEAVDLVANADAAVYFGGWIHGFSDAWDDNAYDAESVDKSDMYLPFGQDELIKALLAANPNTIIVLFGGGPTDMRAWQADAKGIIQAWYPGMEGGNALAAILFGEVNPSGKLPMSFPVKLEDSPAHALSELPTPDNMLIDHKEGVFVGYRYFDTYEVAPAFAFGHGLSYTTFEYSDLAVAKTKEGITVSLSLKNTGEQDGAEVVQVYVKDEEAALRRPEKELKEFQRVALKAGESAEVTFDLPTTALQYYDEQKGGWVLEPGAFTIMVGSSAADIRVQKSVDW